MRLMNPTGHHYINRQFCWGLRVFVWIAASIGFIVNITDKHPGYAWIALACGLAGHSLLTIAIAVMEIAEVSAKSVPMELAPLLKVRPASKATDEEKW